MWVNFTCKSSEANPPVHSYVLIKNETDVGLSEKGTWTEIFFTWQGRKQTIQGECFLNERQPNSPEHEDRSEWQRGKTRLQWQMWLSTQRIGKDIRASSYFFTRRAADVVSEACFTVMTGDRHDERAAMDFSMIIPNCTQNHVITYTKIIFLVMPFGQIWSLYLGVQWICFLSLIRLKVIGILYSGACWIPTLLWKKRRVKREFISEWFNSEIQATVVTRNHLHRKATLRTNVSNWRDYCLARNGVVYLICNAKCYFYRNSINNSLENPENLWCIIRSLLPSKCSKLPVHLTVDDKKHRDYYDIANLFKEHLANISSSVQLNHFSDPPDWECSADYVDSRLPSGISYCIPPISEYFVRSSL